MLDGVIELDTKIDVRIQARDVKGDWKFLKVLLQHELWIVGPPPELLLC